MANITTPEFRVSYPNVFKPKMNDLSNKEEFSLVALFPKGADLSKLKKAVDEAIAKKWGADKSKHPKNLRLPFRDQAERIDDAKSKGKPAPAGYEPGAIYLNLKSNMKPGLVDAGMSEIIDETAFYAGCFARASVSVYCYDQKGNRGVSIGLQHIQKLREGESLGGRPRVEEAFEPVAQSNNDIFND